jgi:signal peptidase II
MVAGGIGNIIDRIRLHFVVDYIEPTFIDFAVFNFADCLITVGAFVLMIYLVIDIVKDEKTKKEKISSNEFINDETVVEDERN